MQCYIFFENNPLELYLLTHWIPGKVTIISQVLFSYLMPGDTKPLRHPVSLIRLIETYINAFSMKMVWIQILKSFLRVVFLNLRSLVPGVNELCHSWNSSQNREVEFHCIDVNNFNKTLEIDILKISQKVNTNCKIIESIPLKFSLLFAMLKTKIFTYPENFTLHLIVYNFVCPGANLTGSVQLLVN